MVTTLSLFALILTTSSQILAATTPTCTTHYGSSSKSPIPTTTKTSTLTTTLTESIVYVTTTVSSGTTTVPTSNGFTPILLENTSIAPGPPADAAAVNAQQAAKSYPASVVCSTTTRLTITKTATAGRAATTVTSTTTVTAPAATFYAACDADNIVAQGKGLGAGSAIEFATYGPQGNYTFTEIVNTTAYACCVACQTTYPCAFSQLSTYYGFVPQPAPNCFLAFDGGGGCDGGRSIGPAEYYYDPANPTAGPGQGFIFSNGACGQIIYGGAF